MKKGFFHTTLLFLILGVVLVGASTEVFGTASPFASNYERGYAFDVQYGYYRFGRKLQISMPPSLYDYYHGKSHIIRNDNDYAKFVTPGVFKLIAENIHNVTGTLPYSEEQFANAVLMLVRQVPYAKSDVMYPAESIVRNSGDCDVLSLLAASIMKAGGLDVVLLYYKGLRPSHMNIGVHLPYTPAYRTWWLAPAGFKYNNKTYWMAECTPLGEWKVGDCPDLLADAKPQIISLETCEDPSPAHVASTFDDALAASAISITMYSENASAEDSGHMLTIAGSISPPYAGKSVTMYVSQDGFVYNTFRTTSTDEFGNYSFTWNFTSTGASYIRTSLSGFSNYSSSDSEKLAVFTGFYRPPMPTEGDYYWSIWYNDALSRANSATLYGLSAVQRSKDFLHSNLTGSGVLLCGEFMVLRKEEVSTPEDEQTITIPGYTQSIKLPGSRRYAAVHIPEQVISVPSEQRANSWFGFILRSNGESNYTANIKVLNDDDAARLTTQLTGNSSVFMNASVSIREEMWYKATAKIFEGKKTAELYDGNGTLLQNITDADSGLCVSESGILVAYEPDAILVFKNLKAETLSKPEPSVDTNRTPAIDELAQLAPCIGLTVLLAVAVAAKTCNHERNRATSRKL